MSYRRGSSAFSRTLSPEFNAIPPNANSATARPLFERTRNPHPAGPSQELNSMSFHPSIRRTPRPYSFTGSPQINNNMSSDPPIDRNRRPYSFGSKTKSKSSQGGDIRNSFFARELKQTVVRTNDSSKRHRREDNKSLPVVIDLDEDEGKDEIRRPDLNKDEIVDIDEFEVEAKLEEELQQQGEVRPYRDRNEEPLRNALVVLPWAIIERYIWTGSTSQKITLRPGKTVELKDASIFQIDLIIQNFQTDEVCFRGVRLERTRDSNGILHKKVNELYYKFEVDRDDVRPPREQSTIEITLDKILKVRKLICTNAPFPEGNPRFDKKYAPAILDHYGITDPKERNKWFEENEALVVRWRYTSFYKSASNRLSKIQINFLERTLETLSEKECTPTKAIPADVRRRRWRGETKPGGSGTKREAARVRMAENLRTNQRSTPFIDLSEVDENPNQDQARDLLHRFMPNFNLSAQSNKVSPVTPVARSPQTAAQCYTFGDSCKLHSQCRRTTILTYQSVVQEAQHEEQLRRDYKSIGGLTLIPLLAKLGVTISRRLTSSKSRLSSSLRLRIPRVSF